MDKRATRRYIQRLKDLPSPPPVATRIISMAANEAINLDEVARLISSDQSVALRVLHYANSSAYGMQGMVRTLEKAVAVLGVSALTNLMLSIVIRSPAEGLAQGRDELLCELWKHSLGCAVAAQLAANMVAPKLAAQAFAGGLMHDCGKLALLAVEPVVYERLLLEAAEDRVPMQAVESQELGLDHTQAGKWLADGWQLPEWLLEVIWLHHGPVAALGELLRDPQLCRLVALGNHLAHEVMADGAPPFSDAEMESLTRDLGLDGERLEEIRRHIGEHFARHAGLFDLEQDTAEFYYQALQRANALLSRRELHSSWTAERNALDSSLFRSLGDAGIKLLPARSLDEVLAVGSAFLQRDLGVQAGAIVLLDGQGKAHGVAWRPGGSPREFAAQLPSSADPATPEHLHFAAIEDQPMTPEGLPDGLPDGLPEVLAELPRRVPPRRLPAIQVADSCPLPTPGGSYREPFHIFPLQANGDFLGEIYIQPAQEPHSDLRMAVCRHCALLLATTLERIEMLSHLEEQNDRLLAAMRKVRQADLDLLQAERLAAVGQLAAGAAHEINNPLAIISARAQMLARKEQRTELRQDLETIIAQIDRISGILQNLLRFARPQHPEVRPLHLGELLDKTLAFLHGELEQHHIRVTREIASDLPFFHGDAAQIEQVLLNVLLNAIQSMEPDGGNLTVRCFINEDASRLVAEVCDTGIGMEPAQVERVFEPFFTTKEQGKGTGLGLSTALGIVRSHNGRIRITSTLGKGTCVRVLLPTAAADPLPEEGRTVTVGPDGDALLLLHPDEVLREVLSERLERHGLRVAGVDTLDAAAAALERLQPRVVLLAGDEPVDESLRKAKRLLAARRSMRVFILVGSDELQRIQRSVPAAIRLVQRPVDMASLAADIRAVMDGGQSHSRHGN